MTTEELLERPVDELEGLSVRSYNYLRRCNFETIGELLKLRETQLLKLFDNFGIRPEAVNEIKKVLAQMGLCLGMDKATNEAHLDDLIRTQDLELLLFGAFKVSEGGICDVCDATNVPMSNAKGVCATCYLRYHQFKDGSVYDCERDVVVAPGRSCSGQGSCHETD